MAIRRGKKPRIRRGHSVAGSEAVDRKAVILLSAQPRNFSDGAGLGTRSARPVLNDGGAVGSWRRIAAAANAITDEP